LDIGVFVPVEPFDRTTAQELRRIVELSSAAEQLGYCSLWVASRHFSPEYAALPSPLVLLAAASQNTSRLVLGSSVVALPLEHPMRLAEDFATVDALSNERVRLGVGSGDDAAAFEAFGVQFDQRQGMFSAMVDKLLAAFDSEHLVPAVADHRRKVAIAAQSARGAAWAASLGVGLLQGRSESKLIDPTVSQANAASHYRRILPNGRVTVARNAWVGKPDDEQLLDGLRRYDAYQRRRGRQPLPEDLGEAVRKLHITCGQPPEIAAQLMAEANVIGCDELLLTVDPGGLSSEEVVQRLGAMAKAFSLYSE